MKPWQPPPMSAMIVCGESEWSIVNTAGFFSKYTGGGSAMEYFVHGANVLYLFSYLVRDILWLRMLTVVAASTLLPFFYFRPEPLLAPIYWNLLFTVLNLYWIVRLILERRPVHLTGNDLRLYQLVFRCLTPREMLKLLKLGLWEQAAPEQLFIRQGDELERLMVICSGRRCEFLQTVVFGVVRRSGARSWIGSSRAGCRYRPSAGARRFPAAAS